MTTKNKLIILSAVIMLITVISYLASQSATYKQAKFYTKLMTGQDSLSGLDDKMIYEIKYPKILTKNGLRPEIENELYTGSRDKECTKNNEGNCIPDDNSYIGSSLLSVKKEDKKYAELYLLGENAARQYFLKDLSASEAEKSLREFYIFTECYYNVSSNHEKYSRAVHEQSRDKKYRHPLDFFVSLKADKKISGLDYRGIEKSVKEQFKGSKDKCKAFLSAEKK